MIIAYPNNPIHPNCIDDDFTEERNAAVLCGFKYVLYSHETLEVFAGELKDKVLLRGWMLTPAQHELITKNFYRKGCTMITNTGQYQTAHYFSYAYRWLRSMEIKTPYSIVCKDFNLQMAWALLPTDEGRLSHKFLIKDYVKSAKHLWDTACILEQGMTYPEALPVLTAFLKARGTLAAGGFVFKEFLDLKKTAEGKAVETRFFIYQGKGLVAGNQHEVRTEPAHFQFDAKILRFPSPFFTFDMSTTTDGQPVLLEMGDGGVSGLPQTVSPLAFYASFGLG